MRHVDLTCPVCGGEDLGTPDAVECARCGWPGPGARMRAFAQGVLLGQAEAVRRVLGTASGAARREMERLGVRFGRVHTVASLDELLARFCDAPTTEQAIAAVEDAAAAIKVTGRCTSTPDRVELEVELQPELVAALGLEARECTGCGVGLLGSPETFREWGALCATCRPISEPPTAADAFRAVRALLDGDLDGVRVDDRTRSAQAAFVEDAREPAREISVGQAWDEAHAAAAASRQGEVGCGCGLDGRDCDDGCGCPCHRPTVH